jgi:zinc resistance-associated protein
MWKAAVVAVGALVLAGTTILMAQDRGAEGRRWMGPGMAQGGQDDGPGWHRRGDGPGWRRWGGGPEGRDGPRGEERRWSADDMRAFVDARIAALHAGLELKPDQEKNWPAFEQAVRAAAKDRVDRIQARQAAGDGQQQPAANPVERLKRVAEAMSRRGAVLKQIADSAEPLYQSLDDAQKNRFRVLARIGRGHHHHGGWRGRFEQRGEDGNR